MKRPSGASDPKPRALVLSPEPPYPMHGGGAVRTASIVEYLRRRYEVDLVIFREEGQPQPDGATHVVTLPRHSRALPGRAFRNLRRLVQNRPPLIDRFAGLEGQIAASLADWYELAVIEHFWCAQYIHLLRAHSGFIVLDLHNVESLWLERAAGVESGLARAAATRWARRCRHLENELLQRFDLVLVPSDEDACAAGVPCAVYPNALPGVAAPDVQPGDSVVFSGNLEYHPNLAAIRYFGRDIWPKLRECRPNLEWRVVGRNDVPARRILAGLPRVRVVGSVDDALSSIAQSRVAVVPVLSGSGTRFKIIEAWAAGVPVVSTTIGAEGLPARSGEHLLIADDASAFVRAISRLLDDQALALQIRRSARDLFEREFTWEAAWQRLDALLL
jgi:polysaccharide biosynthesis protein PslH